VSPLGHRKIRAIYSLDKGFRFRFSGILVSIQAVFFIYSIK